MVEYFRPKVRPGAGWTYPTGVGPVGGVMSDPNLFYSHVGLGVGGKDFPASIKPGMHRSPSYAGQVDVGSPYKDVYKKYDVSSKPAGFHHEQQNWVDQQILNSPLNTQGATPEKVYETYMGLGSATPSERQRNKAGRIIEEARASARETRPELFTEPATSGEAISPSLKALVASEFSPRPSSSNEILQQSRFSNLQPLGPEISVRDTTRPQGPINSVTPVPASDFFAETLPFYSPEVEAIQNREFAEKQLAELGKHPFGQSFTSSPATSQEVSGEQAAAVPIDPTNLLPQVKDYAYPLVEDQLAAYEEYGLSPTDYKSPPGSGYLYSHPVLKAEAQMPFSELSALAREDAPWQKFVGPAMTAAVGSQIPGAGLLGLFAAGLNKLGAYDQFNPATDSNLFADPETGRATWGTTDPGGSGSQRGTLNLYNMLQDLGGRYPNRQVQTPSRIGPTGEIPQYANARDLAYIMGQGDRPPPGLYSQQTPLGYQDFGGNVTNQEALRDYAATGSGAILNQAAEILGPDAGYNETSDLAASMAEDLQDQMDYSDQDWGDWI